MHAHYAHQLTVGITQPVCITLGSETRCAPALFIPAGIAHRLSPGNVLSLYLDPTTDEARAVLPLLDRTRDIVEPSRQLLCIVLDSFSADKLTQHSFERFRRHLQLGALPPRDARLDAVLHLLNQSLDQEEFLSRRSLASSSGLSESRFSHWFRERTGMPVRSYRKWLRLVRGIEHVLAGDRLTDAAHGAGFSDQAHFTRTFVATFGINPSLALARLSSQSPDQ
ncbi:MULTISPECIES: AraC family transcriptional regulator [Noviherbaspirillum]|uniref:AraC family transcriptional regulator n=1 Tax=Noviherbaspirillum TaxID=1344552 RepID=UPI00124DACCE|nr:MULTISPECIES: helix-turn-helix domain-containing protein [Noviherbaspirillum]